MVTSAVEHHAVLDSVAWLGEAAGATVHWLPVDQTGRIREADLDAAVGPRTALVSVMWGNNEVGTLQPVSAVAARAAEHGALSHSDAVQAVGHVPVDFAASGLDLLSFTAHKLGGPYGVGALLARREVDLTAVQHGGGQERDVRSGTLDVAAVAGFAAAVEVAVRNLRREQAKVRALRELLVASITSAPGTRWSSARADRADRLPGVASVAVPRLLGRGPADAAGRRRHRLLHRIRLLGRRGPAEPRAAGHGAGRDRGSVGAALLPRRQQQPRRPADPAARPARRGRPGPGRRRVRVTLGPVRVLAAMSGGVDSAVAAARAVDAGHEVTGVHLALAKNPQSFRSGARGCCSKEDAHDARRAADVLGIPFYVWDLSDRFAADVVDDFVAEYAAGRTPNPCLRCNEKIKFAAVLDRARALGFDAVCTGHYARLVDTATGVELHRANDSAKDQSYVLGVLTQDQLRHALFPLGADTKPAVRAEAERRGLAVADKPDSHDICFIADGDTAGFLSRHLGERAGAVVDQAGRDRRHPLGQPPVHRRPAARPAAGRTGRRRAAAVRAGHLSGDQHGHRRAARGAGGADHPRHPADLDPGPMTGAWSGLAQLRAHGSALPATAYADRDGLEVVLDAPATGVAPGQAVVLYDATRVVGCATIAATAA